MSAHTNVTIVRNAAGLPDYVVIPFSDYQAIVLGKEKSDSLIPGEVIKIAMIDDEISAVCSWRKYLKLTQADVATRMGISQAAYSKLEGRKTLRKSTREKAAKALNILPDQLDW